MWDCAVGRVNRRVCVNAVVRVDRRVCVTVLWAGGVCVTTVGRVI